MERLPLDVNARLRHNLLDSPGSQVGVATAEERRKSSFLAKIPPGLMRYFRGGLPTEGGPSTWGANQTLSGATAHGPSCFPLVTLRGLAGGC